MCITLCSIAVIKSYSECRSKSNQTKIPGRICQDLLVELESELPMFV